MPRCLTVLVALLSLALVAGCGGGDKKKTHAKASSSAAVIKADYETKLLAGLRPAQAATSLAGRITKTSSRETDARVFEQVGGIYQKAYNDIKGIVAPAGIADLHKQVAAALQGLGRDSTRARDSLRKKDGTAYRAALVDFKAQGLKLQSLGKQLTARGY